jgi:hypothetical protein
MDLVIRKLLTIVEEQRIAAGAVLSAPLIKVAAVAVIENPLAGKVGADVTPLIEIGGDLGELLAKRIFEVLPKSQVQSFGKAAIVGSAGELEHSAPLLHPTFGKRVREVLGRGRAIIPSTKKTGTEGCAIDAPMVFTEAFTVVSHFDAMEIRVPGAPRSDEIVIALVMANGGRPHARTPGLQVGQVQGRDGLV